MTLDSTPKQAILLSLATNECCLVLPSSVWHHCESLERQRELTSLSFDCRLTDLSALDALMAGFEALLDEADDASDATELLDVLGLLPLALRGDHATADSFLQVALQSDQPS